MPCSLIDLLHSICLHQNRFLGRGRIPEIKRIFQELTFSRLSTCLPVLPTSQHRLSRNSQNKTVILLPPLKINMLLKYPEITFHTRKDTYYTMTVHPAYWVTPSINPFSFLYPLILQRTQYSHSALRLLSEQTACILF